MGRKRSEFAAVYDTDLGLVIVGGVEGDPVLADSTLETTADGMQFSALSNVPIRMSPFLCLASLKNGNEVFLVGNDKYSVMRAQAFKYHVTDDTWTALQDKPSGGFGMCNKAVKSFP